MTHKEQDKRWNDLSEENKEKVKETYNAWLTDTIFSEDLKKRTITLFHNEYGEHNLNPKPLTYEDVAMELFKDSAFKADLCKSEYAFDTYPLNCTSEKQTEKLLAINKLLNVAKYLNGDWKPDLKNHTEKWSIGIDGGNNIRIEYSTTINGRIVYFRTKEIAQQAVQILGEDVVRTALTTEY